MYRLATMNSVTDRRKDRQSDVRHYHAEPIDNHTSWHACSMIG